MKKTGKIQKSLRASFWDGLFASAMQGLTADYVSPYALSLGATTRQIGFLSAFPNLIASLAQLKSPEITSRFASRKKTITFFVLLQVLMGIPIIAIPYLMLQAKIPILIVCVALFTMFGALSGPPWSSLMSDYIPMSSRGKYFAWRSKILGVVIVGMSFLAGFILYLFQDKILFGFLIILSLAALSRFISFLFLNQMIDIPLRPSSKSSFTFLEFIGGMRHSNFARFVLFVASLNFCVNLAAPYFPVLMLRDLKFSYVIYTVLVTTVPFVHILTISRWGRHADKFGNLKVIKVTAFIIATLPLWWLVSRNPVYLVFAQAVSGFAWAGFGLSSVNYIYDAVTPEKRTRCIAYFNVCVGLAIFGGALLGGHLVNFLPALFGYKILSLFVVASVCRFIVIFFFLPRIKEVRHTQHIHSINLLYSVLGVNKSDSLSVPK